MDLIYCDDCRRHHDSTHHTGEPVVAEQAKRDVKAAWASSAHHRPDPIAAKGSLARSAGSRSPADGPDMSSSTRARSDRRRGGKRPKGKR